MSGGGGRAAHANGPRGPGGAESLHEGAGGKGEKLKIKAGEDPPLGETHPREEGESQASSGQAKPGPRARDTAG